ncbi:hypothetical protein F8O01_06065 [Pseudoclavibacter chungangensis]|uniref:Large extracellular alpha-helical protein n=1 Tax=Pseudoclavibacter chungangensis TaxID=587635 RepID=A0A7J5BYR2_9MICO|nr:DUF5719 family protein [Pseudoclavibacter chungangensis]KAB1659489.1 hypothetical protein F8O01_06065 [Pseudoclavibacter chungangensis]NYJ67653.1 hypothetical protein [Pseudoclavibacter chungangensis]
MAERDDRGPVGRDDVEETSADSSTLSGPDGTNTDEARDDSIHEVDGIPAIEGTSDAVAPDTEDAVDTENPEEPHAFSDEARADEETGVTADGDGAADSDADADADAVHGDEAANADSDADEAVAPVAPAASTWPTDHEPPARRRPGSAGRFTARGLAGLVGLALAATTVWAVTAFPLPSRAVNPPVEVFAPVPGDQQRVCAGPLAVLGLDASTPTDPALTGTAAIQVAGDADVVDVTGIAHVGTSAVAAPTTTSAAGPADFTAPGTIGDTPTTVSVAQSVALSGGARSGLAATACTAPSADQWVVGGSTTSGRSALLSLVNPTDTAAVVRADVYTEAGLATTPSLVELEVPAGAQRVVSLEGVVPDSPGFAVHVAASGAPVAASMHLVAAQGLTPLGIDIVGATASPSTRLDVVGVPFTSTASESDESLFTDRSAVFRALVTGDEAADVVVTVRELDGTPLEPITATLQPGAVTDIPLSSFPVGRYTVTLESSAPVVGAVRSSTAGTQVDMAWYAPSPALSGAQVAAVPAGPTPRVAVANPGTTTTAIRVRLAGGDERTIEIAPGATWQSEVPAGSTVELDGLEGAVASVTYDGPGQLAGMPVQPGNPLAEDLRVYR